MPDFATRLAAALPMIPAESRPEHLRHGIRAITGRKIHKTTTWRYLTGRRSTSPEMDALLAVIADPTLIEELRK